MKQLDLFSALTTIAAAVEHDEPHDDPEPGQPPKRTQITGPLPGVTFEDAFGKDAAE